MDKRIKILVAGVLLPLSIIVPVYTMDAVLTDGRAQAQTQATDPALKKRLEKYKDTIHVEMSKSEIERFQLRCQVAQTVIVDLAPKVDAVDKKRSDVYGNVLTQFNALNKRLKAQGVETKNLDTRTKILQNKISTYNTQMGKYKQAIDDLSKMDCAADPQGFKAGLEVARRAHVRLRLIVEDIRIYVSSAMKPSLEQAKEELVKQAEKKDTTEEDATDATH